jgi:PhoPQ-activated pathogenicity-related protein
MRNNRFLAIRLLLAVVLAAGLVSCATFAPEAPQIQTALDRYVHAPDSNYAWRVEKSIPGQGSTTYVLSLTSQAWRSEKEVNRPVWTHWLAIEKPDKLASNKALLMITGGDIDDPAPEKLSDRARGAAVATGSVVAELRGVPNEPLTFIGDETEPRTEDGLIAYTWDKYLRTGDELWPARLPMTKAAVRAMDAITEFCASAAGGGAKVDRFVVTGSSKRGWTTWTTGAVDKRVIAIAPMVIDMLNIVPSFKHHYQSLGFWAPAVDDYEKEGIMNWMDTPEYAALMKIVEPYEYRDRYTMPKLTINATGDQFFLPDSPRFFIKDLPGETLLRMVPNADHGMRGTDAAETLLAFYGTVITGTPRPRYSWEMKKDGSIVVKTVDKPREVLLWQATNPTARDFRVDTIGKAWTSSTLEGQGNGVYVARVPKPEKGWTAFLVELTYDIGGPVPLKLTSEVGIVPDTLPFKPFTPAVKPKGFMSK